MIWLDCECGKRAIEIHRDVYRSGMDSMYRIRFECLECETERTEEYTWIEYRKLQFKCINSLKTEVEC
jgi:hypothetical protein